MCCVVHTYLNIINIHSFHFQYFSHNQAYKIQKHTFYFQHFQLLQYKTYKNIFHFQNVSFHNEAPYTSYIHINLNLICRFHSLAHKFHRSHSFLYKISSYLLCIYDIIVENIKCGLAFEISSVLNDI